MAWKSRQQSEQSDSLLFLKNLPTHVQEHVATNVHTIKIILDRKHGVIDDELDDEYVVCTYVPSEIVSTIIDQP